MKYIFYPISYLILRHYSIKYGISISTNIEIGEGLCIVHGGNVYVNVKSIGKNFTIYQGVTLGVKTPLKKDRRNIPTIKDNVSIGTNAVVLGNVILEDNCWIGANSVVTKSIKSNEVVVGMPVRILTKNK